MVVFRSVLGRQPQSRNPSAAEIDEMRKTVSRMVDLAAQTDARLHHDVVIEFADEDGLRFREMPSSRWAVLGAEVKSGRADEPVRVELD